MSTVCCPSESLALQPRPAQRLIAALQRAWSAWRAQSRQRAELRALEQLSDSTRRDIGLAERQLAGGRMALWDQERGTW